MIFDEKLRNLLAILAAEDFSYKQQIFLKIQKHQK